MRLLRGCEGEMLRAAGSRSSCTALDWSAVMRGTMMIMIHVLGAGMYSMMIDVQAGRAGAGDDCGRES